MRSVPEHQQVVADLIAATPAVVLPLADTLGRPLAADLVAPRPLPAFDNSAMDGYAVRAGEVASASVDTPVTLPVASDIPAGRIDVPALEPGTVARIMTGAPMPVGADAVVQVEATDGGVSEVTIHEPRAAGVHVRRAGEDVAAGETVLIAGTALGPAQLGLLSALGLPEVAVRAPLRVLVLSTGTELVPPGQELLPGQIHESNGLMLAAAVREAGGIATQLHAVADDVDEFHATLAPHLADADLLLTSGGVSAGAYEVVKDALTGQGVEFAKVAMQPGMPQGAGRFAGVPVVTLPGNPVSSLVSFEVFVRPAIRAAMGYTDTHRPVLRATLTEPLTSPAGKRQFRRGLLEVSLQGATVRPIGPPASHYLRWLAASNALLDVPAEVDALAAGDEVDVWPMA
ncbi:molybdopterin molybdotransferase MoeA [Jatrophihabitans sp. YIM 134969]